MSRSWLLLLSLLAMQANAFPIILGGAGAFALGTAFLPMLLVALLIYVGVKLWRLPRIVLVAICITGASVSAVICDLWASDNREAILTNTQSLGAPAHRSTDIPYPYVSPDEQAASPSRMTPAEFYGQLSKRAVRVIRVDLEPQMFKDFGFGATATQIHENPDPIVALAEKGQSIVLVDERGTTASAVADALNKLHGTHIRFLEGGANALNEFAWDHLAVIGDSHAVLPADVPKFKKAHSPEILSTTNPDEFLNYGWMHGLTVSLPVFLSGADAIAARMEGKTVLITAAESHYSGDTWILLDMLRARGIDAYFMQPTREELLVKPAYFRPYKNADRYIGADETMSYVLGGDDVRFLDFQPKVDWARTKNQLPRTDHIDMETVAKGELADALSKLDRSKRYLGLAYDRRTFYHSILAGEVLSGSGVKWLGIDTQPELFNRALLTDQDLIDPTQVFVAGVQNKFIRAIGEVFEFVPGSQAWVLWLNVLTCFAGAVIATQVRTLALKWAVFIGSTSLSYVLWVAYVETTQIWVSDDLMSIAPIVGAIAGWLLVRRMKAGRTFSRDDRDAKLPAKIALLQRASELGYPVEQGFVVTNPLTDHLPKWVTKSPVIVRSAAQSESSTAFTVGVYDSIRAEGEEAVRDAIRTVHAQISAAGETSCCLIQPLLENQVFGVAMFGTGTDGHLFICEGGESDAVTAGTGSTQRFEAPVWTSRGLDRRTKKVRAALFGLYRDVGATTIEWAISTRGELTVLQVSTDILGRPALNRLMGYETRNGLPRPKYVASPVEHETSLGAAVVSAMAAPGDQCSIGGVRFIRQRGYLAARALQLVDIVRVLDGLPRRAFIHVPGELLLAAFEGADEKRKAHRETIQISTTAPTEHLALVVAAELGQIADLYGRFSRICTTALELKNERTAIGFSRALSSTVIGSEIAGLSESEIDAYVDAGGYASVATFSPSQGPAVDAELVSPVIQTVNSPLAWIKDQCAVTMMIELGRLRPAINELAVRGASDALLSRLSTYRGESAHSGVLGNTPRRVRDFLTDEQRGPGLSNSVVWGVPRAGLELQLTTPETFVPGAALYLENTDMRHLATLPKVGALVVSAGSSLSHLLQHARRLNIPHVIGFSGAGELTGTKVRITTTGEVLSA